MTEDKAKKTRCCGPAGCGFGIRNDEDIYESWCIASKCMAWREHGYRDEYGKWFVPSKSWSNTHTSSGTEAHGYCGLAGKP